MVRATIQGIDKSNNREHITAQNGKLITGEAQRECVSEILRDCREVNADDEVYCELDNGKLFCALYHPIKDDIGRKRIGLITLDRYDSEFLVQETLESLGLNYEKYLELRSRYFSDLDAKYLASKSEKTKAYIGLGLITVAAIGIAATLALKK